MAKGVLNVLVFLVLLVFCAGFGGCTYKPLVLEERETAWNYDWNCYQMMKQVVEEEKFVLETDKRIDNSDKAVHEYHIDVEDGVIHIVSVPITKEGYPTVSIKYTRELNSKPYLKCNGMNIGLFSKIIEIYTGIEITEDMFGELFYNPEHQYKDSGIKGDNAYYNRMAIRPVGIKYAGFFRLGALNYWLHATYSGGKAIGYTEDLYYSGYHGCCIESMNKEVKY